MKITSICLLILLINLTALHGVHAQAATDANNPPADAATDAMKTKLRKIVFPKVKLRNSTVQEIADFLSRKSVLLDTTEPDPSRRGVKIRVDQSAAGRKASISPNTMTIPQILDIVGMLSGVKYTVGPDGILISLPSKP
jgi:hypothetical protein